MAKLNYALDPGLIVCSAWFLGGCWWLYCQVDGNISEAEAMQPVDRSRMLRREQSPRDSTRGGTGSLQGTAGQRSLLGTALAPNKASGHFQFGISVLKIQNVHKTIIQPNFYTDRL